MSKPDIVAKWFQTSPPTARVVVIVDPDSRLVGDLSPYIAQVSKGHALTSRYAACPLHCLRGKLLKYTAGIGGAVHLAQR